MCVYFKMFVQKSLQQSKILQQKILYSFTYLLSLWYYNPQKILRVKDRKFICMEETSGITFKGSTICLIH